MLEVGRIIKAHGLRGQVLVDLWTDRVERLQVGNELFSDRGTLEVISAHAHQDRFIVSFDVIKTREDAEQWRGVILALHDLTWMTYFGFMSSSEPKSLTRQEPGEESFLTLRPIPRVTSWYSIRVRSCRSPSLSMW